jgi:uncharacterized membrane protein
MAKPENEFYEMDRLSCWLTTLLVGGLVLTVVSAVSTLFELRLFDAFEAGTFESEEAMMAAAKSNDQRQLALAILGFAWFTASSILGLVWIYRSAHNAGVHARRMEYSPGACVWWYFVPIATFWKPYSAMKEIWSESARQAGQDSGAHGGLLVARWTFWIIMCLAYNASLRLSLRASELSEFRTADHVALFGALVDLAATSLFIVMVHRLGKIQEHIRAHPPQPAAQDGMPGANW